MRFHRELSMSSEEAKMHICNCCNCNISPFRITQLSFLTPKGYGLFCAAKGDYIFISIHTRKEWAFRAPKRHLRICLNDDHGHCSLRGSLQFSDFITYLLAVLVFCAVIGIGAHSTHIEYYIIAIIGYMVGWYFQCLVGIFVFRKDEKMLLNEVNLLLDKIVQSKKEQRKETQSNPETDEKQQ